MKKTSVLIIIIISIGIGCEKGHLTDSDLLDCDWVLTHIQDTRTNVSTVYPADALRSISIHFYSTSDMMFFTGECNSGSGKYEFTSLPGELIISDIAITEIGCTYNNWESYVVHNLQNNSGYRITGNKLDIYSNSTYNLYFTKN
jgi:heat shock protein HslJ